MPRHPIQSAIADIDTTKSSVELGRRHSEALIKQTLAVWQPRADRVLTEEDARQIIENTVGFFRLLHEWDKAARQNRMIALRAQQRIAETPPIRPGKIVWRRKPPKPPKLL